MKKNCLTLLTTLYLICSFQITSAQSFQKSFGKVFNNSNTDQQELNDILNLNNESILVSGTFRNVQTFPEIAFYGTISNVSKTGMVNWYKGYLPSNFSPFDSFFITSLVKDTSGNTYAYGTFLTVSQNSGYILMKISSEGNVIYAKKVTDEFAALNSKIIIFNDQIFSLMGNKIVKFDLVGNIIAAFQTSLIDFNDISINTTGEITLLGQYYSTDPSNSVTNGLTVIRLSQDLSFIRGGIFYSSPDSLGSLFSYSIYSNEQGTAFIGGESIYFSIDTLNTLNWAKRIPNFATLPVSDSYGGINTIKKHTDGTLYFLTNGFFSESDIIYEPTVTNNIEDPFQYYFALCKLDPANGSIISSKEIKNGFFNTINHFGVGEYIIDSNEVYFAGSIRDYFGEYKLNYIHKTTLEGLNCGENNRSVSTEDVASEISYLPFTNNIFSNISLMVNPITITEVNIPINFENQSCSPALNVEDNQINEIKIYPNPSSSFVSVDGIDNIQKIEIIDTLGRLIKTFSPQSNNQYDVSFLNKGVYYFKVLDTNQKVKTIKLIKN